MEDFGIIGFILIALCFLASYKAFKDTIFFNQNVFHSGKILGGKEYKRLITSGFLHINWLHLLFNIVALHSFGSELESTIGILKFGIIYFCSLIGGNLFSLYIHRNHYDYTAAGASGAISGIVFACIALFPGMEISFLYITIVPAWAYSLLFTLVSIYGIKSQSGSIGHEAHLGGGITGMLIVLCMYPSSITENYLPIAIILIPSLVFITLIIYKPHLLLIDNPFKKEKGIETFESKYNKKKRRKEEELDRILEKIHKKGMNSLSKEEKEILEEFSSTM